MVADGRRFFFPGATKELALVIARANLGNELDAPECTIEFGTRNTGAGVYWVAEETIQKGRADGPDE
jgi:hypothetical protein